MKTGIKNGTPQNKMKGPAFQTELATAYPDCRLVVTKETMTVEGMIKIVYDLLKDKLNIAKITFTSGVNAASAEFQTKNNIDRCPLCGIALNENGICPKCGYKRHNVKTIMVEVKAACRNAGGFYYYTHIVIRV